MADGDVSKRYAVSIDLNVDSSNLEKLNSAEDIYTRAFGPTGAGNSGGALQEHQVNQIDVNTSAIESKLEKIINIISSQNSSSKESINEAVIKALSDSFKSSFLDIIRQVNAAFSLKIPKSKQDKKTVEKTQEPKKQVKSSKDDTIGKSDMVSSVSGQTAIQRAPGSTANTTAKQAEMMRKVENSTGVKVGVVRNSPNVSDGAIATTVHKQNPSILMRSGVSRLEEYASLPHEYRHVFQQSRMFNTNNFLSNVFGGGSSFGKDVVRKANEFVTNMMAAVNAALDKNLNSADFEEIKKIYIKSIKNGSGIGSGAATKAISSMDYLRGLNISPESVSGIIGRDIQGISSKNGTELERAIASSGRKDLSVKDGSIYIGRGKGKKELTSAEEIYKLGLKNSSGHALDRSTIASHYIARGLIGGLGSIEVPQDGSRRRGSTIAKLGYGRTRAQAADEFYSQSSFGVPILPREELQRRFRERSSISSIEQMKSIMSSSSGTLYRDGNGRQNQSAKRYDNYRFGLNKFQSLAYALGGDNTLKIAEKNGLSNAANNPEALQIIRLAHLFGGDASAEQKYISGLNQHQKDNYNELVRLFESHADSYLSQEEHGKVTFRGFKKNKDNQQLGNAIYTMGGLAQGVKMGKIRPYYVRDTKKTKAGQSRAYSGGGIESIDEELQNAGEGITRADTIGELDEMLTAESIDTKEITDIKNKFEAARDRLESLREQLRDRKKITSGISKDDLKLIGGDTKSTIGDIAVREKISPEERRAAIKEIDAMLVSLKKQAESELAKAKSKLGEDYSDYDIQIGQSTEDIIRTIIDNYKHAHKKSSLSGKEMDVILKSIMNQLVSYNDDTVKGAIDSGIDIDILGTKLRPEVFKDFREGALSSFGNYLGKHGGNFASDMAIASEPGNKKMLGMSMDDKLKFLDDEMSSVYSSISKTNNSEEIDALEKRLDELLKVREKVLLAKAEIDSYTEKLSGTLFSRGGVDDNALAYASVFGRASGPYELATGKNAQLSVATGGYFDADRFATIRKNGHERIVEDGFVKKKYAPIASLPVDYINRMSLFEEPTMGIVGEAKRLADNNSGNLGMFKGGNQISPIINDFLSERLHDGVSASPQKYDRDFTDFVSNFFDKMNNGTVSDDGSGHVILKAGKMLYHGTDKEDGKTDAIKMADRYDTGIHFGQDLIPGLSRLIGGTSLQNYGVTSLVDKFNKDYDFNGITIKKGDTLIDHPEVLEELMKNNNRKMIQATLTRDVRALKMDGRGVNEFEGIDFRDNNGEMRTYKDIIGANEGAKHFMDDYSLYGKRLFEAIRNDLGDKEAERAYNKYAPSLTDSKNIRQMLKELGYGAVIYSNDAEDNGRNSIMMTSDDSYKRVNDNIFGTNGGVNTFSSLFSSLKKMSEFIAMFNTRMEMITSSSGGYNGGTIGTSDMAIGNSGKNPKKLSEEAAGDVLSSAFGNEPSENLAQKKQAEQAQAKRTVKKKRRKKDATDNSAEDTENVVGASSGDIDRKLESEIAKLYTNILNKFSSNNSNNGIMENISSNVDAIKDMLSKHKNTKTVSLSKRTISDILSSIPKSNENSKTINIKSIEDIKSIVSAIKDSVSKHKNAKTFSLSKRTITEISSMLSNILSNSKDGGKKPDSAIFTNISKDVSAIKDYVSKRRTSGAFPKKIAEEISNSIKQSVGEKRDNSDKYNKIIEQLRFIRQNTRTISTKLDRASLSGRKKSSSTIDKDIKSLVSSINNAHSSLGKSILDAIEKGFSGVVINMQPREGNAVAPKVDAVSDFLADAERQRRLEAMNNMSSQLNQQKDGKNARAGSYESDKKRLDRENFELELSSKQTKSEKLAFIDEKISKLSDKIKSSPEEEKTKLEADLASLKRRRIRVENSPGTHEDKLRFTEWRDALRTQQREFIASLKGKGVDDVSRAVTEEIRRLSNLDVNKSVGNYDKKLEIQKLTTKLKEFEQASRVKSDKNSLNDAVNELKRKYKGEDNAFDATLKGASIDERPAKLKKEIDRLNAVLDELAKKKEAALSAKDNTSAKFYDTLIFQRQTRKDVVTGKYNAAEKSLNIANRNAELRAEKEAIRAQKQQQKQMDALASSHEKRGNQARSVFNKAVEYGAMSSIVYGVAAEYKNAIDVMSKFERQMVEVTRVMDPLRDSQEALVESAKRMAIEYGVSVVDVAKGMTVFAQQGKDAVQVIQLTEASLLAANTTTLNAAEATEALTAAIRQFNLTDADAKRIIDSWLEVESRTAITASTMADAIKISGTAARLAGISFDEFNGMLSAVGSATRETGSQLGTAFKFIISKLRTDDAVTALNRLGVATHTVNGTIRSETEILSELNSRWQSMSAEQRASTAITIAGTRRYNTLMTLMEKWPEMLDAVSMSEDSHGKAMRMNSQIMETYEKKVQKARASIEAFYVSMSKGATKGVLGGLQKSVSALAQAGEKLPLASSFTQVGLMAGSIGFASRIGSSMGLDTAIGDLISGSKIRKEISSLISDEVKQATAGGSMIKSEAARRAALDRLSLIDQGLAGGVRREGKGAEDLRDGRDALAEKITARIAGTNKETELYNATLKKVQNELSRTISSHQQYIEKLDRTKSALGRSMVATGEFIKKHAATIAGIGIGLQTLANSEVFKDKNSLTGKTTGGEVVSLLGTIGTAVGAGAATAKFAGPTAGVAVGVMTALGEVINIAQSWFEKWNGSQRLTLLRLQEESDRLKTLTTSVDAYAKLREKEGRGESLTLEELDKKRALEDKITLAYPGARKIGHRGIGSQLDDSVIDSLIGRKSEFKDKYGRINDEMAYRHMFQEGSGGKTVAEGLRTDLFRSQSRLDVAQKRLEEFDKNHQGELTESEHRDRAALIESINKLREEISKTTNGLRELEQNYFASVRNGESRVLDSMRRNESVSNRSGVNRKRGEMFQELVKNRGGDAKALSSARREFAEAELSAIFQTGRVDNRDSALANAEKTGKLHMLVKGREHKDGTQDMVLLTRGADGSYSEETINMKKMGSKRDYAREVAARKGMDESSIAYSDSLSDTFFRYSLKEIEKFAELTRKIGDVIYNSYKLQVERIASLEGVSSRFRIGGVETQYMGSDIRLEEARRGARGRLAAMGIVRDSVINRAIDYSKETNQATALSMGVGISSDIARNNTLAGQIERLTLAIGTQIQRENLATQLMQTIASAEVKTPLGRDSEIGELDLTPDQKKRIDEYLAAAGLNGETYDTIRARMPQGSTDDDFKKVIMERISAASDVMSKKDSDEIARIFKSLESSIEDLANVMKQTADAMEGKRRKDLADMIDNSGIVMDSDIVSSYSSMSKNASMYDKIISIQETNIASIKKALSRQDEVVKIAENAVREAEKKHGRNSMEYASANEALERARNNRDQSQASYNATEERLAQLKELQQQIKAMSTASYGEHKAYMTHLEPNAINASTKAGRMFYGTGASQYNEMDILAQQQAALKDREKNLKVDYEYYKGLEANGTITESQKLEMKSLELQLGEIGRLITENGNKLMTINMNLEKTYAEARRRNRSLQIEHLANAASRSKDTLRSQKAVFDDDYSRMRGVWKDAVSALLRDPSGMTSDQKTLLKELSRKMENLRDIGDLNGNPSFNKNLMLASSQEQAIVGNIMERIENGETMKQIFSDAGMKELGRNNPLISQLIDNMMQKEENQRLADVNNQMLDVESQMLELLRNSKLINDPTFNVIVTQGTESNDEAKERPRKIPGFASGTSFTGSGGKFQESAIVAVHKGEGLGVLNQTAMARYPITSRKVLSMISEMNLGTYPAPFANGTRLSGEVFNYGDRDNIYGVGRDVQLKAYIPPENMRELARIMRVDTDNMWMPSSGNSVSDRIGGFNQNGVVFLNGKTPISTVAHEILHGSHGTQFGSSTAREAMSVFGEMAITGTKRPGYGNSSIWQEYSKLKLGSNPAKNAQAIFDLLGKNGNYKHQWSGINSGLRRLGFDESSLSELGTSAGNRNFKHAYAQAASAIAEYGRNTGTSSRRDIDKMFNSLEKLFKKVTGTSTIDFSAIRKSGEIDVKTFAEACSEFRASVDKNGRISSNDEILASVERRAKYRQEKKQESRESRTEVREKIKEIKSRQAESDAQTIAIDSGSGKKIDLGTGKKIASEGWRSKLIGVLNRDVRDIAGDTSGGLRRVVYKAGDFIPFVRKARINRENAFEEQRLAVAQYKRAADKVAETGEKAATARQRLRDLKSGKIDPETKIETGLRQKSAGQRYLADRNASKLAKLDARIKAEVDSMQSTSGRIQAGRIQRDRIISKYGRDLNGAPVETKRFVSSLDASIAKEEAAMRASVDRLAKMRKNQVKLQGGQRALDYNADRSQYKLDAYRTNPARRHHQGEELARKVISAESEQRRAQEEFNVAQERLETANAAVNKYNKPGRVRRFLSSTGGFIGKGLNYVGQNALTIHGMLTSGAAAYDAFRNGDYKEGSQAAVNALAMGSFALGNTGLPWIGERGGKLGSMLLAANGFWNIGNNLVDRNYSKAGASAIQTAIPALYTNQVQGALQSAAHKGIKLGNFRLTPRIRGARLFTHKANNFFSPKSMGIAMAAQGLGLAGEWAANKYMEDGAWKNRAIGGSQALAAGGELWMRGALAAKTFGLSELAYSGLYALDKFGYGREDYLARRKYTGGDDWQEHAIGLTPLADPIERLLVGTKNAIFGTNEKTRSQTLDEINARHAWQARNYAQRKDAAVKAIDSKIGGFNDKFKYEKLGEAATNYERTGNIFGMLKDWNNATAFATGGKFQIDNADAVAMVYGMLGLDTDAVKTDFDTTGDRLASIRYGQSAAKIQNEYAHQADAKAEVEAKSWFGSTADAEEYQRQGNAHTRAAYRLSRMGQMTAEEQEKKLRGRFGELIERDYGDRGITKDMTKEALLAAREFGRTRDLRAKNAAIAKAETDYNTALSKGWSKFNNKSLYGSYEELRSAAEGGDAKAKEELERYQKRFAEKGSVNGMSASEFRKNNIANAKKEAQELAEKKINGEGPITGQDVRNYDEMVRSNPRFYVKEAAKERAKEEERLAKMKADRDAVAATASKEQLAERDRAIKQQEQRVAGYKAHESETWAAAQFSKGNKDAFGGNKDVNKAFIAGPGQFASITEAKEKADKDLASYRSDVNAAKEAANNSSLMRRLASGQEITVGSRKFKTVEDFKKFISGAAEGEKTLVAAQQAAEKDMQHARETAVAAHMYAREKGVNADDMNLKDLDAKLKRKQELEAKKNLTEDEKKELEGLKKNGFVSWYSAKQDAVKKEARKQEDMRQDSMYNSTVFGRREAAKKSLDDAMARRDSNKKLISSLEKKEKDGTITAEEKEKLKEARNMQSYYDSAVDRKSKELNATNRAVVQRQRAAREGRGGDASLMAMSNEEYNKAREENESRIKELQANSGKNSKRKKELEDKKKSGKLTKEEQEELDKINSEERELSRRKNLTRTMFAETDLRKFKKNKARLSELRTKMADGKTLTDAEKKELDSLKGQDFSDDAEKKLVAAVDEAYKGQNGGKSFKQLDEEDKKNRRRITLDNLGMKSIKYNAKTGRYEAEDDRKSANVPSADERTAALDGETTRKDADTYSASSQQSNTAAGTTQQVASNGDKNVSDISKDTGHMAEMLAQVLERVSQILEKIPKEIQVAVDNKGPEAGSVIPGKGA